MATTDAIAFDPADVAAHYDELDGFYREFWGEHVHHGVWITGRETPQEATRRLVSLVAEQAVVRDGSDVCDVGCGYGATARMLVADYGARVTALTISGRSMPMRSRAIPAPLTPRTWCATGSRTTCRPSRLRP